MDWDIDDAFFEFVNSAVSSEVGSNTTNTTMSSSNFDTMDLTYELNNFLSQHVWKSEEKVRIIDPRYVQYIQTLDNLENQKFLYII